MVAKNNKLESQLSAVVAKNNELESQLSAVVAKNNKLESQLSAVVAKDNELESQLSAVMAKNNRLEEQLQRQGRDHEQKLAKIQDMYSPSVYLTQDLKVCERICLACREEGGGGDHSFEQIQLITCRCMQGNQENLLQGNSTGWLH